MNRLNNFAMWDIDNHDNQVQLRQTIFDAFSLSVVDKEVVLQHLIDPMFNNSLEDVIGPPTEDSSRRCAILQDVTEASAGSQLKLELIFEAITKHLEESVLVNETTSSKLVKLILTFFEAVKPSNLKHFSLSEVILEMKQKVFYLILNRGVKYVNSATQVGLEPTNKQKKPKVSTQSTTPSCFENIMNLLLEQLDCDFTFLQAMLQDGM